MRVHFRKDLETENDATNGSRIQERRTSDFVELLQAYRINHMDIMDAVPREALLHLIPEDQSLSGMLESLRAGSYTEKALHWLLGHEREKLLEVMHEPRDHSELAALVMKYFNSESGTTMTQDLPVPTLKKRTIALCVHNPAFGIVAVEFLEPSEMGVFSKSKAHAKYTDHSLVVTTPLEYLVRYNEIDELLDDSIDLLVVSRNGVFTELGEWDTEYPESFQNRVYSLISASMNRGE